ncbi:unnamed protein product [Parnassius apollo]|uniref:(apollo) hypothetical protein n=1 Tax=Parnassius apollo TaxID=110799 RepID=A0A8S3XLL8_PARAO|nr:unnamed protein product [Parnassius apollo]
MSHRSRRILGLVLKTKESHSDHTSASLSECVKQDTCDIPMFQKISQENIENINPCDTEVAHVVAETASSQKVENVTQYQSVSQTKLNLVPNYDSEGTSNEDKPQTSTSKQVAKGGNVQKTGDKTE